ncbi:TetR/AcrR family transcriptional regulator [Allofournierella sp.]|uniref:TetR/AcrR family transcriptional regulator n=2 Tax=Allofournierella sp. TaxID=1940256 RepID=UPI003AB11F43
MNKQPEITAATRQRLIDAFWTVYGQKRIEQIRVKEIAQLAHCHRGTFYEYFNDIYDLLNQEENEIIIQLEEMLSVRLQGSQEEDGLKNIAEFYLKNGKRLNLLIGTGGYNAFLIRFKKALYPLFRTANSVADTKRSAIIYEFGINGLLMAFHAWYEHQDRMAIEDLLILLRLMIERGIPSAMMY